MELKIKISDSVYKKIQEYDAVPFDELFELFNAIRNGNPVEEVVSNEDCISRQAVLSKFREVCFSKEWLQFRADYGSHGQRDFLINYIEGLPHITPSQKTGQWLYGELIPNDITGNWYAECSECGKVRIIDNYCPHCGSKNEG